MTIKNNKTVYFIKQMSIKNKYDKNGKIIAMLYHWYIEIVYVMQIYNAIHDDEVLSFWIDCELSLWIK